MRRFGGSAWLHSFIACDVHQIGAAIVPEKGVRWYARGTGTRQSEAQWTRNRQPSFTSTSSAVPPIGGRPVADLASGTRSNAMSVDRRRPTRSRPCARRSSTTGPSCITSSAAATSIWVSTAWPRCRPSCRTGSTGSGWIRRRCSRRRHRSLGRCDTSVTGRPKTRQPRGTLTAQPTDAPESAAPWRLGTCRSRSRLRPVR